MRKNPSEFGAGLAGWIRGDDGFEAEAAGAYVAEIFMKWDRLLDARFKQSYRGQGSRIKR